MTAVAGSAALRRPPRRRWLLLPVALAALLHALLLGMLPLGVGSGWNGGDRRALQVRSIVRPAPDAAPPPAVDRPATPAPARPPLAVPAPPAVVEEAAPAPAPAPAPATVAIVPAGAEPVPVYRTRFAPATVLRYAVRRGDRGGDAELDWRPDGERYALTLETPFLAWRSSGGFDDAGLAPERFVDRRRRDVRAANFRRDGGRITYSGPQTEHPLVDGAQDRLSWMLQLAAIVDADPARYRPGTRIALFVTGARADADVWTFGIESADAIELPAGPVDAALHLRREPRRPYDTLVDVWLDPARAHLPVRVRLATPPTGDATEYFLREQAPP